MANNSDDDVNALIGLGVIALLGAGIALFLKAFGGHKKGERVPVEELPTVDASSNPVASDSQTEEEPYCYRCREFGHDDYDLHCYDCGTYGHVPGSDHCQCG